MRKRILLLGLVIALLSEVSVSAQCTKTGGCPIVQNENCCDKVYKPCPIKKNCCDNDNCKCYQTFDEKAKNYINKIQRERATIYNALDLTDEQINQQEEIAKQNAGVYEEKLEQLNKQNKKLFTLKKANASCSDISKQKKVVKGIKNDIKKLFDKEDKAYKKCLTREQRSKYTMLKKLQNKELKQMTHQKNLYKSNPKMRPFGDPACQSKCPCEK